MSKFSKASKQMSQKTQEQAVTVMTVMHIDSVLDVVHSLLYTGANADERLLRVTAAKLPVCTPPLSAAMLLSDLSSCECVHSTSTMHQWTHRTH
eukprot:3293-Heterococcus_DN1.PRE.4